ncbi:right-handed parallel beta-helix repeat-containing protein [Cryobacterium sp. PH29-G1]|uniref:right-handed parallel beta-helix repeat-containing protein n=1 Tax=Cryobacterium sp. PH29-G1 TaxID=3046211 RepID=UPI0024BA8FAB|nr:right-handed parallel beta-helix repeat-containing protein [Cryobacterium sp. PH29-G1]MDJ0347972.1 right-handed parallel beta-helix repeat-containing protein [Cryobacterium sp. PH29-G1]
MFPRFSRRAAGAAAAITALLTALLPIGIESASAATAPDGTTVIDNSSAQVKYSGTWRTTGHPADNDSSIAYSSSTSSASLTFTGSTIAYVARLTSSSGTSDITIDGTLVDTVNGYSATTEYQQVLFSTSKLSGGTHTITVSRTGQRDARSTGTNSIIDAFVTLDSATVATPAPAPTPAPTTPPQSEPTPTTPTQTTPTETTPTETTPAAMSGPVEAPANSTTVDSDSPQVTYAGSWRRSGAAGDIGGGVNFSTSSSNASFTFDGTSVAYITRLTSSSGTSTVAIDGQPVATVDGYAAKTSYQQIAYSTTSLSAGRHTITVTRTGQKDARSTGTNSIVDAFIVAEVASTAPAPAPISTHRYEDCPAATVTVTTSQELMTAVSKAQPGTVITMAPGTYTGQIKMTANGTAANPIWVCGPRSAVINIGGIQDDHGIQITNSSNLVVAGMTVTNGLKGISVVRSNHVTIADTLVDNIGYEGIHLRAFTTDSTVVGNTITNTGKRNSFYGEGIYIGTSENNWCAQTGCQPDATDRILLMGNNISLTGAQPIEVKEGTSNGIIRDNVIDGANAMSRADEWVKVKGNDWQIYNNQGTNSSMHGFAVNGSVAGWGLRNTFFGNTAPVDAAGYGFYIHEQGSAGASGTTVYCSNDVTTAGSGYSNLACIS